MNLIAATSWGKRLKLALYFSFRVAFTKAVSTNTPGTFTLYRYLINRALIVFYLFRQ